MRAPKARKKTVFVPRMIFRATIAGASVVPVCVAASVTLGCVATTAFDAGDDSQSASTDGAQTEGMTPDGVMFPFDTGLEPDAESETGTGDSRLLGVAVMGFTDAGDAGETSD
jgi:hypothetical protein